MLPRFPALNPTYTPAPPYPFKRFSTNAVFPPTITFPFSFCSVVSGSGLSMFQLYLDLSNCFRIAFFFPLQFQTHSLLPLGNPLSLHRRHHHHAVRSSIEIKEVFLYVPFCCIKGHFTTRRRRRRSSSTQIYFPRMRHRHHHPSFHCLYVAWLSRRTHHTPATEPSRFPTHVHLPR
jgi:hypothetical protein